MKVNLFGKIMLATVVLTGSFSIASASPSSACIMEGDKFSEVKQSLPMWVGAIAMTAIAGSVVANEVTKKSSLSDR
jgi:putative heme iron utilization protein